MLRGIGQGAAHRFHAMGGGEVAVVAHAGRDVADGSRQAVRRQRQHALQQGTAREGDALPAPAQRGDARLREALVQCVERELQRLEQAERDA